MPISSLPDSTLRAITSTVVLNNAVSVVKELVDNALDAKATTIAIEISSNTLDVIQVKDNGTGIGVEDRQLVCKRGCTSKITNIKDLEQLGGSSLGFRGEALASVADLSESVTLTTRVDGETAGSMLKYGPAGALLSCFSASHPVGSTVRIKDFLQSIPVRKQTAVKNASKTLSTIKKLLQSYAFARGTVRFSFKVLKGKNDRATWSYGPVDSMHRLRDIATRIIGKDVAGQCEVMTTALPSNHEDGADGDGYSVVALLAIIDKGASSELYISIDYPADPYADSAKLNNIGHFISIDDRPVAAACGTIREVVKLYQKYVRNRGATITELPASFDPLLVMHVSCPRGSYDVNVEPAKDEVLFTNPNTVLALIECLFKDFYGELPQAGKASTHKDKIRTSSGASSSFNLLLAKRSIPPKDPGESRHQLRPAMSRENLQKSPESQSALQGEHEVSPPPDADVRIPIACATQEGNIRPTAPELHSNMYGFDEDDQEMSPLSPGARNGDADIEEAGDDVARNPWSLAKLNAPVRSPSKTDEISPSTCDQNTSSAPLQRKQQLLLSTPQETTHRQPLGLRPQLLSPATSPHSPDVFQNPGPPQRPWAPHQRREEASDPKTDPETIPTTPSIQDRERLTKPLDSWAKPLMPRTMVPKFKPVSAMYNNEDRFREIAESESPEPPTLRGQPSRVQTSLAMTNHGHPLQVGPMGRPFRPPLISRPVGAATDGADSSPAAEQIVPGNQQASFKLSQSQNPELDQIMEFEHRKKAAHAQQRKAFGNATGCGMSTTKIARLQQSSSQASDDEAVSTVVPGIEYYASYPSSQNSGIASFGDRSNERDAGTKAYAKPSSHRNRYLAAARSLIRSQSDHYDTDVDPLGSFPGFTEVMGVDREIPFMSEDDAQAYLMRHLVQTNNANASGLTRAGPKIRRTKTQRLPLESIPSDMFLHDLVTKVDFDVRAYEGAAMGDDRYSTTGKNEVILWTPNMSDVAVWKSELSTLVETTYRARIGDDLLPPNIEVDLRRMIKAHCDNIS